METYEPASLLVKNVELIVRYLVDGEFKWYNGVVREVKNSGCRGGKSFVVCTVEYEDGSVVEEHFWNNDYNNDTSENSWKFSERFVPIMEHVLDLLKTDKSEEDSCECNPCHCDPCECGDGDDEEDEDYEPEDDEDDDEDDDDEDVEDDDEDYDNEDYDDEDYDDEDYEVDTTFVLQRRKPSLINRCIATLFVFSPLIATFAVIYNGRYDINRALCDTYCPVHY